jgi:hypothetical protein
MRTVIHHYTRRAASANLEREIGSICRKIARQVVVDAKDEKNKDKQSHRCEERPEVPRRPEVPLGQDERPRRGRPHERPRGDTQYGGDLLASARSRWCPARASS